MAAAPAARWYNAVWRWHFYAGMLCMPFVLWLSVTGSVFLWKPQIEAWLDRPYDALAVAGPRASAAKQVSVALEAVPGAALRKLQLPDGPHEATRVILDAGGADVRVYVNPYDLRVLRAVREDARPMNVVQRLHGTLLAGDLGSYIVEIAACWTVTMLLTGLYLWWPRGRGVTSALWPRLGGGRRFWRDLHAVAGIWVAVFALFLISTGLPWAKFWGSYFREVRQIAGTIRGPQDWTLGGKAPADAHVGHAGMAMAPAAPASGVEIDRVVAAVYPLGLAGPVTIAPPVRPGAGWTAVSEAQDRPLRGAATIDGTTGAVVGREDFDQRHWLDRLVGYGIAAHEGALFGLANQLLGTVTALLLATLSISGAVMWWRRRPDGLLGAPVPLSRPRLRPLLASAVLLMAILMPLFGATLAAMLLVERLVLRRMPATRHWLGLRPVGA